MKTHLVNQQLRIGMINNMFELLEVCDKNIENGLEVDYFNKTKEVIERQYNNVMNDIVNEHLKTLSA